MDFELTDDQVALQDGIRTFCAGRFPIEVVRANEETGGGLDRDRWSELAGLGVFSLRADGFGVVESVLAFEELGTALVPGPLVATYLAATHLDSLGGAADGSSLVGLTWAAEPVTAVEYPDDLDVLLVLDATGIRRIEVADLTLERATRPLDPLVPVGFTTAELPAGAPVGDAALAAQWRLEGAVLTAALQLGVGVGALNLAVAYAKQREQFGKPIGTFQAVKHMAADMLTKTEVARAAVYAAACALDGRSDDDPVVAVAVAKLMAGEAALFAAKTGIQIHGGMGFTWEVDAQRYWKRACVLDTQFGNGDHHAEAIASAYGKD